MTQNQESKPKLCVKFNYVGAAGVYFWSPCAICGAPAERDRGPLFYLDGTDSLVCGECALRYDGGLYGVVYPDPETLEAALKLGLVGRPPHQCPF